MVIVTVEEAALLLAVDGIVGGVEVEDQVLRRRAVRGDVLDFPTNGERGVNGYSARSNSTGDR